MKTNDKEVITRGEKLTKDTLAHWGVLGMKWGVRRTQNQASIKAQKKIEEKIKTETAKTNSVPGKTEVKPVIPASQLSDKELKDKITRFENEMKYAKLTMTKAERGKAAVKEILINTAKGAAAAILMKAVTEYANTAIKNAKMKKGVFEDVADSFKSENFRKAANTPIVIDAVFTEKNRNG